MRNPARRALTVSSLACLVACGGAGGSGSPTPATVISVGGTYQITPTVTQNPCGSVQVLPGPATVSHAPGSTDLTLTHVGQTYSGTVDTRGAFQMRPQVIDFGGGSTDTVTIAGTFSATGFDATVTVATNHTGAAPCTYVVRWVAAKQGAPNVIP